MKRTEEVEMTNMCMIQDGNGKVLVQDKKGSWHGWTFPGGHVEQGEYVTPSVVREIREETGLTVHKPRLCGIKEFHTLRDGKRYVVFLYVADTFTGELQASGEGDIFWYPLKELMDHPNLAPGFQDALPVFLEEQISELFYQRTEDALLMTYC